MYCLLSCIGVVHKGSVRRKGNNFLLLQPHHIVWKASPFGDPCILITPVDRLNCLFWGMKTTFCCALGRMGVGLKGSERRKDDNFYSHSLITSFGRLHLLATLAASSSVGRLHCLFRSMKVTLCCALSNMFV